MNETSQNSGFQIRLPLILAATLALGMFLGQKLPHYDKHFQLGATGAGSTFDEIMRYVQARYVDSIDVKTIENGAIEHLLSQLDPHSVYITPDEMQASEDDLQGGFEGVGIEFLIVDDTLQVVSPLSGGPAESVGIMAGDKFITISDTTVAGVKMDNGQIFKKLRGTKGSQVKVGVLRGHETTLRYFNITRDVIAVNSVDAHYMIDDQTGYLKVNRFTARTYTEFMEALAPMVEQKGMKNLIVDLRGNPGGYLEECTDMLSQIFSEGKLLVYTQGRTQDRKDYKSNGRARFVIDNIAVLIDEGSASASEIFAGAVQDWDRGWIIGRRSFGKGLVQEPYPLSNGGGLRLTVSRYYTPSGRSIQRDYKSDKDYRHEAERRLNNGELTAQKAAVPKDTTPFYTGMGRVVYAGGGITPDVFIPLDTSWSNDYFFAVRAKIPVFIARWFENNPNRQQFPSDINQFVASYNVDDNMLNSLLDYAEKEGTPRKPVQLAVCKNELKRQIKARIAKQLFGENGLYQSINDDDPAVEKAVSLLRSGTRITAEKKN
ncbi:MAG: S41 family peptidase [Saprospiraceae bacterium]|nr:S41 family peptidase [Saprospiraceae bacterium]